MLCLIIRNLKIVACVQHISMTESEVSVEKHLHPRCPRFQRLCKTKISLINLDVPLHGITLYLTSFSFLLNCVKCFTL